jgi:aminomethyltransferase
MQYTLTRNVKKLSVGQVVYTAMCYENGCMLDDGTLFKFGQDNFRWIGGDEYSGEWLKEQAKKKIIKFGLNLQQITFIILLFKVLTVERF